MPISELHDMNPKFWMKRFQKNSVLYLIKMAAFYHLLSIGLTYVGSQLVVRVITDYQEPSFPVS
ncbi:MAG TPA: CAAX protease, partial [Candidatus Nitrosotenuis sp.]|nr:CAAX protease [Candidatus Nitrosotenuis sp.]